MALKKKVVKSENGPDRSDQSTNDFDEELYKEQLTLVVEEELDWAYNWSTLDMVERIMELEKKWGAFSGQKN